MVGLVVDVINLDFEDLVLFDDKLQVWQNIIQVIGDIDWGNKMLLVRINGLDMFFWYCDVIDLLEQVGEWLDQIMILKVGNVVDVYVVDVLVMVVEVVKGCKKCISFEVIIESVVGIVYVEEIVVLSLCLQVMLLGVVDFVVSMGMVMIGIGGMQEDYYMLYQGVWYWFDLWYWVQVVIVVVCCIYGVLFVDGLFGDFSDDEGFCVQVCRLVMLGMVGKWVIYFKQVVLLNEVFLFSEKVVIEVCEIFVVMEEVQKFGVGVIVYNGRLVDIVFICQV